MAFVYLRTVFFRDTDAAGVVYFTNILSMCHEAYEASLAAAGVDLKQFFGKAKTAFPIAHASVDFFRPMFCGDRLAIQMQPKQTKPDEFEITYHLFAAKANSSPDLSVPPASLSRALSRHVCIDSASRTRSPLSAEIIHWLDQWSE
ncbi:acyl-CoA thioesterase [Oculatella sp. FACHB-28]|uniref:acyl-CoA thioesterase n=1 Tax=Oculatella sp. FACHB-28 TaxID=2692845 RepID=UPI00168670F9|nr:thioesterase family protein [Oculatella sp. FACHB-28]MBD2055088.1 acyl-CoA thioesterase [Oculatella sp. FACHB-28]